MNHGITTYAHPRSLLSEHYQEAFGYPALPFTLRTGITIMPGGESWQLR